MDPIASPIPTWNGICGLQTWHIGRLQNVAINHAVSKPDRVLLSEVVVEPDVVFVLVLSIGIGIEGVAV